MSTLFWGAVFAHIFIVVYFHHQPFSGPLYMLGLIFVAYKTVFQVHKNFKLDCVVKEQESEKSKLEKIKPDSTTEGVTLVKEKLLAVVSCGGISVFDSDNPEEESSNEWYTSPEGIFPTEVWQKIFANLKNLKDVTSCYYTCNSFRRLLEFRMRAEGFSLIYQQLDKLSPQKLRLQKVDLLNSRLVSHSWKLSVDHFLQHHPSHTTLSGHCLLPTTVIDSNDTTHVEGLIERLVNRNPTKPTTNPFPSRHLWLTIHPDMLEGDQQIFYAALMLLLKYFGTHLWYITVDMFVETDTRTPPSQQYEKIYQILCNTPLVRMAHVCFYGTDKNTPLALREEVSNDLVFPEITFPGRKQQSVLKIYEAPDVLINFAVKINKQNEKLQKM